MNKIKTMIETFYLDDKCTTLQSKIFFLHSSENNGYFSLLTDSGQALTYILFQHFSMLFHFKTEKIIREE